MSLLDQLWDDTVAGPRPDNGLGRLRKFRTFDLPSDSGKESYGGNLKSYSKAEDAVRVTRSIMKVKPPGFDNLSGSTPVSPAGSTPRASPFFGRMMNQWRSAMTNTDGGGGDGDGGGGQAVLKDHFDSAGGQHPMHTRDPARLDERALFLLLTTCEL